MNDTELKQLLLWRLKRGYKGLTIRPDKKAWAVNYGPVGQRTSKNFPFNPEYDLLVLWQLDEACIFIESNSNKANAQYKMFGPTKVSRLRRELTDGNDLEGVFLEKHNNGLLRLQFQLYMPTIRYKYTIPKKLHDPVSISWCLAFGRQLRALSFDKDMDDLSQDNMDVAWSEFVQFLKRKKNIHA